MSYVKNTIDSLTGKSQGARAERASIQAADVTAGAEREKLDYLKEINALPQDLKEKALAQLGGAYGLEGFDAVDLTQRAKESPLFQAQMGNIGDMTQTAIDTSLSTASATGGLRGGNLQGSFGDIAERQKLAENEALAQSYQSELGGLGGLAGLQTNEAAIAQSMGNVGAIRGQGIIGGAQGRNQANQAAMSNLFGLGGAGAMAFSDRRLKKNVVSVGSENGFNLYTWDWNDDANKIGLFGSDTGHMADEVEAKRPELVSTEAVTGYKQINYGALQNG